MDGDFFADYKDYIVLPEEPNSSTQGTFNPKDFAAFYILTLSLNDPLITSWSEAERYEIDANDSLEKVLEEFNRNHKDLFHLQSLEFDSDKPYFVLALSCRSKIEESEAETVLSSIVEKMLTNPFYIGQNWYKFIGEKGRVERKLFLYSYKEYKQNSKIL
ncbi:hypothetical protein [Bacillus sp. MUM 13]|uniref:hypothetical protein n=1 Tax=Bacillus sp. MUM 13 TaxID=1678001 RepID=UPI0008F5CFC6|nr:hypothetical protein [Bacillus sp. MUM 13]OIK12737.1 hypothetical protein BIV59_07905 [Bacillus sp. MUM 13]